MTEVKGYHAHVYYTEPLARLPNGCATLSPANSPSNLEPSVTSR